MNKLFFLGKPQIEHIVFLGKPQIKHIFFLGKPQIEHIVHDRELIGYYPLLYSYNNIFKLNTWCDHSQWTHCF